MLVNKFSLLFLTTLCYSLSYQLQQMKTLNWGIVGLGKIAHSFVQDLQLVDNSQPVAAASRSLDKAKTFSSYYKIPKSYGSYTELFNDPAVDIVYIATPHDSHAELSIEAMRAGKHVLCEKPLAVNSKQVQSILETSRKEGVFMMEALWSKFNPAIKECLRLISTDTIGEVNYLQADFSFNMNHEQEHDRMLNMELAGGSLLDMGIYPVFLAYSVFGKPADILATSRFHRTGADIQTAIIFKYKNGIAQLMSGFASRSDMVAKIYGTAGRIHINPVWHESEGLSIYGNEASSPPQQIDLPKKGKGYTYEIEECMRCISEGKIESPHWSHQNSLDLIDILDQVRRQIGLRYPFE